MAQMIKKTKSVGGALTSTGKQNEVEW